MLEIGRILVPTDFSDHAAAALAQAVSLAETHYADLSLLHVIEAGTDTYEDESEPFPGEEEARRALDIGTGDRVSRHVARSPSAGPTIVATSRDQDVDLIVMGSHGRTGLKAWLLGSVTEEVIRFARRPVLIVNDAEGKVDNVERILVPIDFSDSTATLVAHAGELATALGASLEFHHVVERPRYPDFYMADLAFPEAKATTLKRLEDLAEDLEIDVDVGVSFGRTVNEIVDKAGEKDHTMIVMGSHGYSPVVRLLLGSVAEGVARSASCPVMIVRNDGKSLLPGDAGSDQAVTAAPADVSSGG